MLPFRRGNEIYFICSEGSPAIIKYQTSEGSSLLKLNMPPIEIEELDDNYQSPEEHLQQLLQAHQGDAKKLLAFVFGYLNKKHRFLQGPRCFQGAGEAAEGRQGRTESFDTVFRCTTIISCTSCHAGIEALNQITSMPVALFSVQQAACKRQGHTELSCSELIEFTSWPEEARFEILIGPCQVYISTQL